MVNTSLDAIDALVDSGVMVPINTCKYLFHRLNPSVIMYLWSMNFRLPTEYILTCAIKYNSREVFQLLSSFKLKPTAVMIADAIRRATPDELSASLGLVAGLINHTVCSRLLKNFNWHDTNTVRALHARATYAGNNTKPIAHKPVLLTEVLTNVPDALHAGLFKLILSIPSK
jgi:hypothetical protein